MTTTQQSAPRFALDEDKAREWLALSVEHFEGRKDAEAGTTADIGADWNPGGDFRWDGDASEITAMLWNAQDQGVISKPDGWAIEWDDCSDENGIGYRWEVWHDKYHGPRLSGHYEKGWGIGDQDAAPGAEMALSVLNEAVRCANSLLDDLDAYVSSLPLAVRAPEIAQLVALLPRGEWGSDELGTLANWLTALGYDTSDEAEQDYSDESNRYLANDGTGDYCGGCGGTIIHSIQEHGAWAECDCDAGYLT